MKIAGIVPWQNKGRRAGARRWVGECQALCYLKLDFGAQQVVSHAGSEGIKSVRPAPAARRPRISLRFRYDPWRIQFTAESGVRRAGHQLLDPGA
jgi:hypothetical protein